MCGYLAVQLWIQLFHSSSTRQLTGVLHTCKYTCVLGCDILLASLLASMYVTFTAAWNSKIFGDYSFTRRQEPQPNQWFPSHVLHIEKTIFSGYNFGMIEKIKGTRERPNPTKHKRSLHALCTLHSYYMKDLNNGTKRSLIVLPVMNVGTWRKKVGK